MAVRKLTICHKTYAFVEGGGTDAGVSLELDVEFTAGSKGRTHGDPYDCFPADPGEIDITGGRVEETGDELTVEQLETVRQADDDEIFEKVTLALEEISSDPPDDRPVGYDD